MSDRAKALIKLAHTGLGCLSIPDLFHLSHDLAKGYSLQTSPTHPLPQCGNKSTVFRTAAL